MVSDPDNQNVSEGAPVQEAPMTLAGFSTAAQQVSEESVAERETRKSLARQLADYCASLWNHMKKPGATKSIAASTGLDGFNPYEKFWFRSSLGHQVWDCGNCIQMSGNTKQPVTQKQIERMVLAAINRKDPPWETIYMYNHKGLPDLQMAQMVQHVIGDMRMKGKIPSDCKISCCVDASKYPPSLKDFHKMLKNLFRQAANPDQAAEKPGFTAQQRPGFLGAAPA